MKTPLSNNSKCTPDDRQRWHTEAAAAAHNVITIIIQQVLLESLPNRREIIPVHSCYVLIDPTTLSSLANVIKYSQGLQQVGGVIIIKQEILPGQIGHMWVVYKKRNNL